MKNMYQKDNSPAFTYTKEKFLRSNLWHFIFLLAIYPMMAQQTTITVFDEILFYDGYAGLVDEDDLYEPVPPDVLRHNNARYAKKLTSTDLDAIENTLEIQVNLKAACDNYDRLAHVFLAFVDKGETTYTLGDVERIEVARFITPFMNKNFSPTNLDFNFTTNNVAEILTDPDILADYDIWVELEVFGVPYAAQDQVAGCSGRIDTFYATLDLITEDDPNISYTEAMSFLPLTAKLNMNNYNDTDVPGETTRIIDFEVDETIENATLYLITSNHGANSGGEEYNRRSHFVYLNDDLVHEYIPGGKSCEPFRVYNTQGNGIFGPTPRSNRMWLSFSNWCPGDVIPIREVDLGTLTAGTHTFKIDVPDAVFVNDEGYIPVSAYIQNRDSGAMLCQAPEALTVEGISTSELFLDWVENGTAEEWEVLYGPQTNINIETISDANNDGSTGASIADLNPSTTYQIYVRSLCTTDAESTWAGPITAQPESLSLPDAESTSMVAFYPNPVTDFLFLRSQEAPIRHVTFFDLNGRKVLSQPMQSTEETLSLGSFKSGVYFMTVRVAEEEQTYKILKK